MYIYIYINSFSVKQTNKKQKSSDVDNQTKLDPVRDQSVFSDILSVD